MHSPELKIMCCWLAARLRRLGFEIRDDDPELVDALTSSALSSTADVIRLDDAGTLALIRRVTGDGFSRPDRAAGPAQASQALCG